jgi:hypothetical protein
MSRLARNELSLALHSRGPSLEPFMKRFMSESKSRSLRFPWVIGGS